MKIPGVFLSIIVIFLNVVPCCWNTCDEAGAKHVEETSGTADACSPFLSCGSCAGFVQQGEFTEFSNFNSSFDSLDDQEEGSFKSDYSIRIWHPPKEV